MGIYGNKVFLVFLINSSGYIPPSQIVKAKDIGIFMALDI